ncbi:acyl-CoA--sterol O-acyltransferase 1-like [Castanea sativa]|uniref:acyl-CoA--sterol O-acyltransferase 1-like n=1 Tax=Castanea sativa TaxID=21020 RepID=UPI003F64FD26
MEGEINKFIKVWLSILVCLSCCYAISKIVSKDLSRLLCVLPFVCLFIFLPLDLHSIHLRSTTAFFIVWLANFKLLLFAFGRGSLCSDPSISLGRFVALACLPIKIQQNTPPKKINPSTLKSHLNGPMSHLNGQNKENPTSKKTQERHVSPLNYAIKGILFSILARLYDYNDYMHPKVIMLLYCFHIYFLLKFILAIAATLARALLGIELEPQFNELYLTTSLQDFWGRRSNLMVNNILRLSVYNPTHHMVTCVVGQRWAQLFATFVVSRLMHELMFYYMGLVKPSWEVIWFFLLHGLCLVIEIVLKEVVFASRFRLPWLISGPLTNGFVIITSFWLFFPPFLRFKADERAFEKYAALGEFLKKVTCTFIRLHA